MTQHTGTFLGFSLPQNLSQSLALPDGMASSEMHLTMIYLGNTENVTRQQNYQLRLKLATICSQHASIQGEITGAARFWSKDPEKDPYVLLYSSAVLSAFRLICLQACHDCGIYPPENYGFIPHITLGYYPKDTSSVITQNQPRPLEFSSLEFWYGQEKTYFPLRCR